MPTYVYKCSDCAAVTEKAQRITEVPLTDCPKCAGKVKRQIQPVAVAYHARGFHCTDYPSR